MEKLMQYYFDNFGSDLDKLLGTETPRYFGGSWHNQGCPELNQVAAENRPAYVTCLYYSVLCDQGLCHHTHEAYKKNAMFPRYPKFCPGLGRGHMNPRGILRYPMHWGLVSPEDLMKLALPASDFFVPHYIGIIGEKFPKLSLANFFHLLVNFPEVNFWEPRETRKYSAETKVEQRFLAEMLAAIRDCGF